MMEATNIRAGQELYRDGDPSNGLYLVVSGEFEMVKRATQRERELARLGPGAIFGVISLLTRDVRTVTARALVDSSVLLLPAERFQPLVRAGSPAALKVVAGIAEVLAQRLASANAKLVELTDKVEAAESAPVKEQDAQFIELRRALQALSF